MSQSLLLSSNLPAASPDPLVQGAPASGRVDPLPAESGGVGAFSKVLLDQITDIKKTSQISEKNNFLKSSPIAVHVESVLESAPVSDTNSFAAAATGAQWDALDAAAAFSFPPGAGPVEGEMSGGNPLPTARQGMAAADADGAGGRDPLTQLTWGFPSATPLAVIDVGEREAEPAGAIIGPRFRDADETALSGAGSSAVETPVSGPETRGFVMYADSIPANVLRLPDTGSQSQGVGVQETIAAMPLFAAGATAGARASDIVPEATSGSASAYPVAGADTAAASTSALAGAAVSAGGAGPGQGAEMRPTVPGSVDIDEAFRSAAAGAGSASRAPTAPALSGTVSSESRGPTGPSLLPDPSGESEESPAYGVAPRPRDPLGHRSPDTRSLDAAGPAVAATPIGKTVPDTAAAVRAAPEASVAALPLSAVPEAGSFGVPSSDGAGKAPGVAPSNAATGRPDAGGFLGITEAKPSDTYTRGTAASAAIVANSAPRATFVPADAGALATVIPSDTTVAGSPSPRAPQTLAAPGAASPAAPEAAFIAAASGAGLGQRTQQPETLARAESAASLPASSVAAPSAASGMPGPADPLLRAALDESIAPPLAQSGGAQDVSAHRTSAPRPPTPEIPAPPAPGAASIVSAPVAPLPVVDTTVVPAGDDVMPGSRDEALSPLSGLTARASAPEQGLPAPLSSISPGGRVADAPALPQAPGSLPILLGAATGRLGEELGHRILWLSGHNLRSAEIQLDPPELGPLQVQVHSHRDGASIHFTAHTAAARDAVESNLPRLRELLEGSGLNLLDVNVAQQQQRGARGEREALESGNPNPRNRLAGIGQVGEVPAPARRSLGLVDDYA